MSSRDKSYSRLGFYQSVQWCHRGEDSFEETGASARLELTERTLAAEIDWPPIDG